jgi:large subunit ribosomal protein L18
MNKHKARVRRGLKTKKLISLSGKPRLVVYKSNENIYGQIVVSSEKGDLVLVSSSTLDKELRSTLIGTKRDKALQVGKLLGERAKAKQIFKVAFDRSGFKFHGRVKALADGAREAGLDF